MAAKPSYEELMNKVHGLQNAPHDIIGHSLTNVFGRQNRAIDKARDERTGVLLWK